MDLTSILYINNNVWKENYYKLNINDSLFEEIYSFYRELDIVQNIKMSYEDEEINITIEDAKSIIESLENESNKINENKKTKQ